MNITNPVLPPLPKKDVVKYLNNGVEEFIGHSDEQLQGYALSAIALASKETGDVEGKVRHWMGENDVVLRNEAFAELIKLLATPTAPVLAAEAIPDELNYWKEIAKDQADLLAAHVSTLANSKTEAAKPYGYVQFIDGVQTQNFARDEAELKTIKDVSRSMGYEGSAKYIPVYATPAAPIDVAASVGSVDTPEFRNLLMRMAADFCRKERHDDVVAHINAHTAAQVAPKNVEIARLRGLVKFQREALDIAKEVNAIASEVNGPAAAPATPSDATALLVELRGMGLTVAVHNDYRLNGEAHTFWLLTDSTGMSYKGEGKTDHEALTNVAMSLAAHQASQPEAAPLDLLTDARKARDRLVGEFNAAARNAALEEAARCMVERAGQHFAVGHMAEQDECIRGADSIRALKTTQAQPAPPEQGRFNLPYVITGLNRYSLDMGSLVLNLSAGQFVRYDDIAALVAASLKEAT
jgi:hypothetical protein